MAEQDDLSKWTTFMVFGGFNDPATGLNFFIVRMPSGRVPFQKKIVPAIRRIVMPLYSDKEKAEAKHERFMRGGTELCNWNIEGEPEPGVYWTLTKTRPTRYLWDGTGLVLVPYET